MPLPKSWTTVTPLSKTITMILFILLPFIGFSAGMRFQQKIDQVENKTKIVYPTNTPTPNPTVSTTPTPKQVACTQDARDCGNGVWVGRTGPNCQFICPKR